MDKAIELDLKITAITSGLNLFFELVSMLWLIYNEGVDFNWEFGLYFCNYSIFFPVHFCEFVT